MKIQLITLSMMASVALIHAAPATDPATAIAAAGSATNSGDFSWFYDLFKQGPKITASSPNGGDAATQSTTSSGPDTDPITATKPDTVPGAVPDAVPASPIDPSQVQGQITDTVGGLFNGITKRQESTHRYQVDDVLRKTPISGHEGGDPVSEAISGLAGKSIGEVSSALKQKRGLPTDALSPEALLALLGAAGAAGGPKLPVPGLN